jgi:hypothetical protein
MTVFSLVNVFYRATMTRFSGLFLCLLWRQAVPFWGWFSVGGTYYLEKTSFRQRFWMEKKSKKTNVSILDKRSKSGYYYRLRKQGSEERMIIGHKRSRFLNWELP